MTGECEKSTEDLLRWDVRRGLHLWVSQDGVWIS